MNRILNLHAPGIILFILIIVHFCFFNFSFSFL